MRDTTKKYFTTTTNARAGGMARAFEAARAHQMDAADWPEPTV